MARNLNLDYHLPPAEMAAATNAVEVVLLYGGASVSWRSAGGPPRRWLRWAVGAMNVTELHEAVV